MFQNRRIQAETRPHHGIAEAARPWNTVSVSQLTTAVMCSRKWWFEKIAKLPVFRKDYFTFGTVFHSVVERLLSSDANGRDLNGQPINLYPPGWDIDITAQEAGLIRSLIQDGIELGLLERAPEREIEFEFSVPVGDGIEIVGVIDVVTPTSVVDHKTTSNFRYALNEDTIKNNIQLLIYAKVLVAWLSQHNRPIPAKIEIRQNVFLKDASAKRRTRLTSAFVTVAEIEAAWNDCVEKTRVLKRMSVVKDWKLIPGPHESGACMKYGGCPFATICCARETVEVYSTRTLRFINNSSTQKINDMGLLSKITGMAPAATTAVAPAAKINSPAPAPTPTPQQVAPPPVPALATAIAVPGASTLGDPRLEKMISLGIGMGIALDGVLTNECSPLWANAQCQACEGIGFNSKRTKPCPVCVSTCAQREVPNSDQFDIVYVENGAPSWRLNRAKFVTNTEFQAALVAALGDQAQALPGAASAPDAQTTVTEVHTSPDGSSTIKTETVINIDENGDDKKGGRPVTTFNLYIDCTIVQMPGTRYVNGDQVFSDVCELVAKARGAESFYALDQFTRRDGLKVAVGSIMAELKGHHVVVHHGTPDMNAFIEGLRQHATLIAIGVR